MISEFEQRLADVLGARLAAPFGGRVRVAGAALPPGVGPSLIVGVREIDSAEPELGGKRPEIVPGAADPRRVLRLACTVEVRPFADDSRADRMLGLDAALFALGAPDFQTGEALRGGAADPGFLIHQMGLAGSVTPLDPASADVPPLGLTLRAEGLFWPVNQPGQTGVAIGEIRIRGVALPIEISPAKPTLVAGGPAVDLSITIRVAGVQRVTRPPAPALGFGSLAFALAGPGGRLGAGALGGGSAGAGGARIAPLVRDPATHEFQPVALTYTPPANSANEELVVGFEDGANGLGVELGRFALQVREA